MALRESDAPEAEPAGAPRGLQVDRSIAQRAVAEHVQAVDATYFESYSAFTIHREMLGDQPRTTSYRTALEQNPGLLAGARVLDVGCGTGILSLFAARGGAAAVVGVDGSARMAEVAGALAAANGLGDKVGIVSGKVEDLESLPGGGGFDVLVSEWMGYCLLFESMLDTVLLARDRFLKPGGAMLPDRATFLCAGVGREACGTPFWDSVQGFDFSHVGGELRKEQVACKVGRVLQLSAGALLTSTSRFKDFDLTSMSAADVEFTSEFTLVPLAGGGGAAIECLGIAVWFDTEFSARFCAQAPVMLSTSPCAAATHWAQTVFDLAEGVWLGEAGAAGGDGGALGSVGRPAAALWGRISMTRSKRHRSLDVSIEYEARDAGGRGEAGGRRTALYEV